MIDECLPMDDDEVASMFHVKHAKGIQGMTEGGGRGFGGRPEDAAMHRL